MAGEKTEQASPKRREDERKKGHFFQSQDIVTAASMICFFAAFKVLGSGFSDKITASMQVILGKLADPITGVNDVRNLFYLVIYACAQTILPLMIIGVVISVIATMVQTRLLVNFGQAKPDFSRMNPLQGIKRMFSLKSLFELVKSLLKIAAIGAVIYVDLRPQVNTVMRLFDMSLQNAFSWTAALVIDIGLKASAAMLIIGIADYFYQWWSYEKEIRMSKDELKEENKQLEGNPEIKGRIRNLQRKLARSRMMQEVPKADVVIRNPTHYAIALKYEREHGGAPVVVAKGRDEIALRIVAIAEENKVYVTENRPLAQALYKAVEIGDEIPAEFYKAVAEILAFIYKLRAAGRR